MGFVWVRRVQRVLSRIILGLSGLSISGSPLMGLSLIPSISRSVCFRRKEKKEQETVIGQEEERGEEVYGETEKEGKRRRRKEN
jgi:hypothetical protein